MDGVSEGWREAERRIEEARTNEAEKLAFLGLDIEAVPESVAGLERIKWIQFLPRRHIKDVAALKNLPTLQRVELWECNVLCNLAPLTMLKNLQHLGLYGCKANLLPLARLTSLRSLHIFKYEYLNDLSLLTSLKELKLLDLSWSHMLKDLSPLASLVTLERLILNGCQMLSDLSPIYSLKSLKELHLFNSIPLCLEPGRSILESASKLEVLCCNDLRAAPNELASQDGPPISENCLPRLKAWRADLDQGQADNHRIKLFVLGNGSAGKTQICRRLHGQAFDPSIPSHCRENSHIA